MERVSNVALAAAWALLFAPVLRWLFATFTGESFRLNLVLLAAVVVAIVVRRRTSAPQLATRPVLRAGPLALAASCAIAEVAVVRAFDANIVSAVLFGLGTYGLAGLYLPPAAWRRAFVPALLLIAVLPFGEQANTYAGFAARVLTARVVESALSAAGVAAISSDTILMMESGVAYVDVPCSGVKSLWTGAVFFLAATYLERRRPGVAWAAIGAVFSALLLVANTTRVTAIVLLLAGGHDRLAKALHEPLGLIGFAAACGAAVLMLRVLRPAADDARQDAAAPPTPRLAPALAAAAAVLALLRPAERAAAEPPAHELHFPEALDAQPAELTDAEAGLFRRVGGTRATKRTFRWNGATGAVLVVATTRWRAHHPPELCLTAAGVRVDRLETLHLAPDRELRVATADGGRRTALYWYQSPTRTTGDLLDRVLADLTGGEDRWVLVSIMLDRPTEQAEDIGPLFELMYGVAAGAAKDPT